MITGVCILGLTLLANGAVTTGLQRAWQASAHPNFSAVSPDQGGTAPVPHAQTEERININTATAAELTRLPGIGPALARRIIEHRHRHGSFKRPQEIIVVRGMSAKRYRQLAHLIRI